MPVADIMRAYQLGSAAACVPSSARTARQEDHPHPVGYQSHRRTQGSTTTVCSHATIGSFSADVLAFFLRRIMFCSPCSTILPCFCATSFSMALDSASRPSSHPKGRAPFRHISKDYDRVAQSTLCGSFQVTYEP
ncbi:uncharacterized protein BO87DRAFT_401316 [Aspergillus neoniger CBS 115656]|uniref:Uncharacterized protein n=1 Tax=Aspergillus neoniger (strain CBS 115656) TaxID=1448310 RepID=A0A318YW07_ASPNB|nr:hypothetical protein BO87DRAFT_401316 [Aspergillus neoniger CBS 115656]PYH29392.1 hypothetical protein BO87DRAFT_401316 [Aspergillus neoniger CBS 115656]